MFSVKPPAKPLSPLEHLIMDVIWQRRSATSEDVRQALAAQHPMKESTARTMLKRLEEKGYLSRRVEGRTNVYSRVHRPESLAAKTVRQIIDRFCGGSLERLLVGMVDNHVVDEKELQRIAQRIARRRNREEER